MKKIFFLISLVCLCPAFGMESNVTSNEPSGLPENLELANFRHMIESMTVNDLKDEDKLKLWNTHAADDNFPLISRSIEIYAQSYPNNRKILFGSGHKGQHGGANYGFSNDLSWYAVDMGVEYEPDALLNIHNLGSVHLSHPNNKRSIS